VETKQTKAIKQNKDTAPRHRVSVDMPEDLWRKARAAATLQGLPMKTYLANLLRKTVEN